MDGEKSARKEENRRKMKGPTRRFGTHKTRVIASNLEYDSKIDLFFRFCFGSQGELERHL